jgi:hypothetical protein
MPMVSRPFSSATGLTLVEIQAYSTRPIPSAPIRSLMGWVRRPFRSKPRRIGRQNQAFGLRRIRIVPVNVSIAQRVVTHISIEIQSLRIVQFRVGDRILLDAPVWAQESPIVEA